MSYSLLLRRHLLVQQLPDLHLERLRHLLDHTQRGIVAAGLQASDVLTGDSALVRELRLRQAARLAERPNRPGHTVNGHCGVIYRSRQPDNILSPGFSQPENYVNLAEGRSVRTVAH